MKSVKPFLNLGGLSILVAVLIIGYFGIEVLGSVFHTSSESGIATEKAERAVTEVQIRMSRTPAFAAISDLASARYHAGHCARSRDWNHKVGVEELIRVIEPTSSSETLDYCVNTDTWEIRADNDTAASSTVDDTAYLDAKGHCFRLTDPTNRVRDALLAKIYGDAILRVIPSGTETSAVGFSCTSTWSLTDGREVTWILYPNYPTPMDEPLSLEAISVQQLIDKKGPTN